MDMMEFITLGVILGVLVALVFAAKWFIAVLFIPPWFIFFTVLQIVCYVIYRVIHLFLYFINRICNKNKFIQKFLVRFGMPIVIFFVLRSFEFGNMARFRP